MLQGQASPTGFLLSQDLYRNPCPKSVKSQASYGSGNNENDLNTQRFIGAVIVAIYLANADRSSGFPCPEGERSNEEGCFDPIFNWIAFEHISSGDDCKCPNK